MKIEYSKDVDIATIELETKGIIDHAEEVENLIIHFTEDNRPVLIEILEAKAFLKDFSEAVKEKESCDDPKRSGKIAKVIRPAYQYFIDEENAKIVRPAQVKLFG